MSAVPHDWSDPFLVQAKEDLRAAWSLVEHGSNSGSTICMLMQMVFEKLAKAAITRNGSPNPKRHLVAERFFQLLDRHTSLPEALNAPHAVRQFITELENAQPKIASDSGRAINTPLPQLEYPWEDATGKILCPSTDLPLAKRARNPKDPILLHCMRFASNLATQIPLLYP